MIINRLFLPWIAEKSVNVARKEGSGLRGWCYVRSISRNPLRSLRATQVAYALMHNDILQTPKNRSALHPITQQKVNGFTLIELLVVMVIIGITVGFALLAFGDFGESKKILYAVEQLEQTVRLAQQQAVIENSTLGLRIDNRSYQILKFQNGKKWASFSSKNLYKIHYFPKEMIVTLKTNFNVRNKEPGIIINSSGETNPFTLNFGTPKEPSIAVLIGQENGELKLTKASTNGH